MGLVKSDLVTWLVALKQRRRDLLQRHLGEITVVEAQIAASSALVTQWDTLRWNDALALLPETGATWKAEG